MKQELESRIGAYIAEDSAMTASFIVYYQCTQSMTALANSCNISMTLSTKMCTADELYDRGPERPYSENIIQGKLIVDANIGERPIMTPTTYPT